MLEFRLNKGAILNSHAVTRAPTNGSSSSGSSKGRSIFSSNSFRSQTSSATSIETGNETRPAMNEAESLTTKTQGGFHSVSLGADADVLWLLACVPEGKFVPKLAHISMDPSCIKSDRDVAHSLRDRYASVNSPWYKALRLRGLRSIEFVQVSCLQGVDLLL